MKKLFFMLLIVCMTSGFAFAECPTYLFKIAKSDNTNVLFYVANANNGVLDSTRPVDIFWIMNATHGGREELTRLERPQFDITTRQITSGLEYVVNVRNSTLRDRDITIKKDENGCFRATSIINGETVFLDNIFITLTAGRFGIPNVHHLDINGIKADGTTVTERITPK